MTQIRQASTNDVPVLLPLVEDYWNFEDIPRFESRRSSRVYSRNHVFGGGWIALVEGVAVGYLLAVYIFSLEHLGL